MSQTVEERLKADFKFFLLCIWEFLGLPTPTPLQYDLADYLQYGGSRQIIQAFRGCGKSWITSAFVVWLLYKWPNLKIMVVSASKERADQFSLFTKRLISEVPWLAHLKPKPNQRDSLIAFDVGPARIDHSPSVKSVGITGQLTGSRADVIIPDDIEVVGNSATQQAREKLETLVTEFAAILKPYDPQLMETEPRICYLGTPQCEMSLYNVLTTKGYDRRIWTAEFPHTQEEVDSYKGELAPMITNALDKHGFSRMAGRSTEPLRFDEADLSERRLEYGKAGYALQFMLNTSLSDSEKYPLRLQDLIVYQAGRDKGPTDFSLSRSPESRIQELEAIGLAGDFLYRPDWVSSDRIKYTGAVLAVDPSGRGKDETVWCVIYFLNGYLFLMHMDASTDGYNDKTLEAIAQCAKNYKVNEVVVESNMGDGMFLQLLMPHLMREHKCETSEVRQSAQKEKRIIDTLEPVLAQNRLVVHPDVLEWDHQSTTKNPHYSLMYQMTRMCDERGAVAQDDRVDCLEIGVSYWVEAMAADAQKNDLKRRASEIQAFMKDASMMFASGAKVVQTLGGMGKVG